MTNLLRAHRRNAERAAAALDSRLEAGWFVVGIMVGVFIFILLTYVFPPRQVRCAPVEVHTTDGETCTVVRCQK